MAWWPNADRSRRHALAATLALAVGVVASPVLWLPHDTARATSVSTTASRPIYDGATGSSHRIAWGDGAVARAESIRARVGPSTGVSLRPLLARDTIVGLEPLTGFSRRALPAGGFAGINGGFWLSGPVGDPNGLLVIDGEVVSEPETQGFGPRGTLGIGADGTLLIDRIESSMALFADDDGRRLDAVNRQIRSAYPDPPPPPPDPDDGGDDPPEPPPEPPGPPEPIPGTGDLVVYTSLYGDDLRVPDRDAAAIVVQGLRVPLAGTETSTVTAVHGGGDRVEIPVDGAVVVGWGEAAPFVADRAEGDEVRIETGIRTRRTDASAWVDVEHAIAAGPQIVADGAHVDPRDYEDEGFSDATHNLPRAPRSAIGVTGSGELVMVALDGRRPEWSVGASMRELGDLLLDLGAVHAVSLDGGGSTQMVVDGALANRPSETDPLRSLATGLFLFHEPHTGLTRLSGVERIETAAAIARRSHPDGARTVVLATAGDFPDALAGGPLAHALGGPLLLTNPAALPPATIEAIEQLGASAAVVLGGTGAVSAEVVEELEALVGDVERIAGAERSATAAAIAEAIGTSGERVALASSTSFADALAAASPAAQLGMPILLAPRGVLPDVTAAVLADTEPDEIVVLGGNAAIAGRVARDAAEAAGGASLTRIGGETRFETSALVNRWAAELLDLDDGHLVVASGLDFPDALAGGPLAAGGNSLLALVVGSDVDLAPPMAEWLAEQADALESVTLLGGYQAISSYAAFQLDRLTTAPDPDGG